MNFARSSASFLLCLTTAPLSVLVACGEDDSSSGGSCSELVPCPAGYTCEGGVCLPSTGSEDTSGTDDAATGGDDAATAVDAANDSAGGPDGGGIDCAALGRAAGSGDEPCGECIAGDDILNPQYSFEYSVDGEHLQPPFGRALFDGDLATGWGTACPSPPYCVVDGEACSGGCLRDVVIGFAFDGQVTPGMLQFHSDWWTNRPDAWEVWVGVIGGGPLDNVAVRVASGTAERAPWQCVTGDPCDASVPADLCCPDGVDAPQRIAEGALIPKFDRAWFPENEVAGLVVYLVIRNTQSGRDVDLNEVTFRSARCSGAPDPCAGACAEGVTCTVVDGAPSCGECPEGTEGDGVTCTPTGDCEGRVCAEECGSGTRCECGECVDVDGCAEEPCFPGVVCVNLAPPQEGRRCLDCPEGYYPGDGVNCVEIPDPVECSPACPGYQSCVDGACTANVCGGIAGACGTGGQCFQGRCVAAGTPCPTLCAGAHGAGNWECVGETGACRRVDCAGTSDCPANAECVSTSENPRGTFDQICVNDSASPCGGACSGFDKCSAASGNCI